jgi:hypothetical protein
VSGPGDGGSIGAVGVSVGQSCCSTDAAAGRVGMAISWRATAIPVAVSGADGVVEAGSQYLPCGQAVAARWLASATETVPRGAGAPYPRT